MAHSKLGIFWANHDWTNAYLDPIDLPSSSLPGKRRPPPPSPPDPDVAPAGLAGGLGLAFAGAPGQMARVGGGPGTLPGRERSAGKRPLLAPAASLGPACARHLLAGAGRIPPGDAGMGRLPPADCPGGRSNAPAIAGAAPSLPPAGCGGRRWWQPAPGGINAARTRQLNFGYATRPATRTEPARAENLGLNPTLHTHGWQCAPAGRRHTLFPAPSRDDAREARHPVRP